MTDLRALAEAATPGPWFPVADFVMGGDGDSIAHCNGNIGIGTYAEDDAAYIAAASPAVVLALLDVVEKGTALQAEWDRHEDDRSLAAEIEAMDALRAALAAWDASAPDERGSEEGK